VIVIKVGGNELDDAQFRAGLARVVASLSEKPVIVHGGGHGTTLLMDQFGLKPRFVDGLRVTDEQTLQLAIMGMVGQASMQLAQAFVSDGLPALGLSGADAGLVIAEPLESPGGDLGAVGRPVSVNVDRLRALLDNGFIPCLAPICIDRNGELLNVNADMVAQAVAAALEADLLVFLTNVAGVRVGGREAHALTPAEVEAAITSGDINGGMIPKTRAAAAAVSEGVRQTLIIDLEGLRAVARGEKAGTAIIPTPEREAVRANPGTLMKEHHS
jgi:acetylglutamate kinase